MNKEQLLKYIREGKPSLNTRLQVGDVIDTGKGQRLLVWLVNDCRAACIPTDRKATSYVDASGDEKSYEYRQNGFNISPNSEYEIIERLGKAGLIKYLEEQKTKTQTMSKKEKKDKSTEEATPKLGKLGGFLGHPITAVIRAMGQLKWEYWEARLVFAKEKIAVADNTIRIQLGKGKSGDGEGAPVEAELKKLRPDASEKPARAAAGTAKNKGKSKKQLVEEEEAAQDAQEAPAKKGKKSKKSKKEPADPAPEADEDEPNFEDTE